ncbi:hybrid sensor histidine kinase/response regulator transcription factor [Pedobacter sp. SG908]|uniref:hybrid sensor histidine kinase/response regulator n=1 Tax=Pedobacter sp. SG908 TaxID=2587135 RepID=UPI001421A649|nr:hybrid sensor histidine kinase/response regulator transcription factor [Pedobacter sp. SG908]NII83757.1 signal transduction histidine kinase/ligand-binding sensor domain-containing protein/DNA-binding response OmpR family regulator [Pedobacter sp. SG908]
MIILLHLNLNRKCAIRISGWIGIICLILCGSLQVNAQLAVSTHFSTEDGLIQNSVLSIAQDRQGFMWFGTEGGLSRFDGLRWRSFKNILGGTNKPSSDALIRSLFWDKQNKLWMGTLLGLITFDPLTEKFRQVKLPYQKQPEVRQVTTDRSGNILASTTAGIVLITPGNKIIASPKTFDDGENILCYTVCQAPDGKIWCGTNRGLFEIKAKADKIILTRTVAELPIFLQKEKITSIKIDSIGRFWFGSYSSGLLLCDYEQGRFTSEKKQPMLPGGATHKIRSIISLLDHKISVATADGLFFFDINTLGMIELNSKLGNEETLRNSSVHSVFQQHSGTIWIGTYYSGLDLIKPILTPFHHLAIGPTSLNLNHRVVSSMCNRNQKELWIGTEGGGINIFNQVTKEVSYLKNQPGNHKSISSNFIKTLFKDKDGNLWIGTFSGTLDVFNANTNTIEHRSTESDRITEVNSIIEDNQNRLWMTSSDGLKVYKRTGTGLKADGLMQEKALKSFIAGVAFQDTKKRLWFANETKVMKVEANIISTYHLKYAVHTISEHQGIVYLGLESHGIAEFNEKRRQFIPYRLNSLISKRSIVSIAFDRQNHIWLASDSGLLKVTPQKKIVTQYTKADGLVSTNFNINAKYQSGNNLFLGTLDGLIYFDPEQIRNNTSKSSIVITGMRIFDVPVEIDSSVLRKSITYTDRVELSHNQNSLTFEFALLDFIKPRKNTFRYTLQGLSKGWTTTNLAEVTFNNLAPGNYTLMVSGNNGSPNWMPPIHLIIKILPPFWATWWAYTLYGFMLISIIFFISRYFVLRTLLKREDELHQYKINFFTNVSHEIRTHLSLISPPIEQLVSDEHLNKKQKDKILGVAGNARRLLTLVNELLDFRKTEDKHLTLSENVQDLLPILEDCLQMFAETAERKQITTVFESEHQKSAFLLCDAFQLKKAIINLLANAYKFTQNGGLVELKISQTEGDVTIRIEDNGRGISHSHLDKLFENYYQVADHGFQNTGYGIGLALSRAIVELHQGTITVTSRLETMNEPGHTCFTISLPKRQKETYDWQEVYYADNTFPDHETEQVHYEQLLPLTLADESQKPTILLAEDNLELATLLDDILNPYYHVIISRNGKQAWEQAKRHIPDLIISDVTMPEMSGFDFCDLIKSNVATNHIPFILLTAKTQTEDVIAGLSHGADVYLTKPFTPQALLLQVNNLIVAIQNIHVHVSQLLNKNSAPIDIFNQLIQTKLGAESQKFMNQLIENIAVSIENPEFGVNELAKLMNMSTPILYKKVKSVTGSSVNDFIKGLRLKKAAELLETKLYTVYQVSYMVGFLDSRYFSKEFKKFFGKLPSEWPEID